MAKIRLDQLLVQRGLVESREKGQRLIMAGEVLVNDQVVDKPGQPVSAEASAAHQGAAALCEPRRL